MRLNLFIFSVASLGCFLSLSSTGSAAPLTASWRYYRPANTGIQGDFCESLHIAPDGNPWIAGYDPSFEEGGVAKYLQAQNRWINVSNVDYEVIGHPDKTGVSRVSDIDADASGCLWMATGRGGLFYNPAIGPSSLKRFGDDNSPIPGGWNRGVEVAPDGTVWFSSYSTVWGSGGVAQFNPFTAQWRVFGEYGGGSLAVQPKANGYYVWTMLGSDVARFDSLSNTWIVLPTANGNPAYLVGNNATDVAGNTWMYRWTNATLFEAEIDLRRPDGSWFNIPRAPFDVQANGAAAVRAQGEGKAVFVDGGGTVYSYEGGVWTSLGAPFNNPYAYDVDRDVSGNLWICGQGGAARRDAASGTWQRYRITNTSQFDLFNNDLSLDPAGGIYACANAGTGYGGMVHFDGVRWTGFNQATYGLGFNWPFPTDNSTRVYVRPSNRHVVVNPMFNYLHEFDGANWTNLGSPVDSVNDVIEDSLGRLWIAYYGSLRLRIGGVWTQISSLGGNKLVRDPSRPGTVWCMGDTTVIRTDGANTLVRSISSFPNLDPQSDQFKGIAIAQDGNVWIGANTINLPDNSALIKYNPDTGAVTMYRNQQGWPFPGQYLMPLAATSDGRIWMQYDSDYLVARRGLCWFDGKNVGDFPAPPNGEPQWRGLPHAAIGSIEVRSFQGGYELWMNCGSRGLAVLTVRHLILARPAS